MDNSMMRLIRDGEINTGEELINRYINKNQTPKPDIIVKMRAAQREELLKQIDIYNNFSKEELEEIQINLDKEYEATQRECNKEIEDAHLLKAKCEKMLEEVNLCEFEHPNNKEIKELAESTIRNIIISECELPMALTNKILSIPKKSAKEWVESEINKYKKKLKSLE